MTTQMQDEQRILERLKLDKRLKRKKYNRLLNRYQVQLRALGYQVYFQQRPVIMVFEGWDAAGKGGAIKRLIAALDPRGTIVHTIAAPKGEDKVRHYLYRFWRRLPSEGQIAIFDRSWYGRVLVERVEGFCTTEEWQRAYEEINQYEAQLANCGNVILKFWIHINKDEQLARFKERRQTPYKAWKLTNEDWRNRQKWDQYEEAIETMLAKTDTSYAPWTVVPGNDKRYARIKVLKTVVKRLTQELDFDPSPENLAKLPPPVAPTAIPKWAIKQAEALGIKI